MEKSIRADIDKKINFHIADEVKYAKKYGDKYFNSGTGFFTGRFFRAIGDSGQGRRVFDNIRKINNDNGDLYTNEELTSKINKGYKDAGLSYKFTLPKNLRTKTKKATGGLLSPEKADLDNDGKLSSYEKARGEAIEESIRESKQEGGLLADDREKFVFGTSTIAKMITNLVKKSPKKDKDFYKKFGEKDLMEYIVMPENLKKFPTKDLRGVIKENDEIIRNIKTDPDERRLDELEFYLDFNDEIEVELYLRENPRVSKKDALEEISIRRVEQEAEDKGIEAVEIAMEKAERAKKQDGGMMMDDQMADMMEEEENKMPMDNQMADMMPEEKTEEQKAIEEAQAPDEKMEDNYVDFLIDEALSDEEEGMLMQELQANPQLSMLFDKVMEVAMEFSGSGPVEGPGSEVSDSIPARLSDGEFVFTAKAVDEIGADNLMSMMKDAEAQADQRLPAQDGGAIREEQQQQEFQQPQETTQNIRVTKETVDPTAMVQEEEDLVGKEIRSQMMLDPYQRHVRS